jgi:alpha-galactosidase
MSRSATAGPLRRFQISELTQNEASVSFKIRTANGPEWYWTRFWTGRFEESDRLSMAWVAPDGHVVQSRIFRRVSSLELDACKAQAPRVMAEKLPLPALRDLPDDGLARLPPMGWSSWNQFKESIDDQTVREIADAMVSSGLRDAGYVYVNIDDGWQGARDREGVLHPNAKFPDMKSLADYVHGRGLKLGIYSSPGPVTCCGYLGSHGHELQDARTFAYWGIDLIRHDWCTAGLIYKTQAEMQAVYQKMGETLRAAGRPIAYTLCQYGLFNVGSWGRKVGGHMWRTGPDMAEGLRWEVLSQRFEENGRPEDQGPGRSHAATLYPRVDCPCSFHAR